MKLQRLIMLVGLGAITAGIPACDVVAEVSKRVTQDPKEIGAHGHWKAYTFNDDKSKVCYMASAPTKQSGNYKKRDQPYALVTNRNRAKGEVNFVAGYSFKKDTAVTVKIGSKTYELFTAGDRAWSKNFKADKQLVTGMIRGDRMVVVGFSTRGTKTTDTYSLSGFTATKRLIDRACKL